jgi:hypothetical protein
MAVTFYNCEVKISTTGILAESASIESSLSLSPAYSLGHRGSQDQVPSGPLKTTISIDYYLKTDREPNYAISSGLRSYLSDTPSPVGIKIAGLGAPAYLERYSLRTEPNSLIKANASYVCFTPLGGELREKLFNANYSGTNASGVGHGWTTNITSTTDQSNNRTLGFSYDFSAKWEPVYKMGTANPVNVLFHGGQETFSFVKDTFIKPTFSGTDVSNYLTGLSRTNFNISSLDTFCGNSGNHININMDNSKVISSSVSIQTKDIVRTNTTLTRYF